MNAITKCKIGNSVDREGNPASGKFACKENEVAIKKLEEALASLEKRTLAREKRGVEGTHVK